MTIALHGLGQLAPLAFAALRQQVAQGDPTPQPAHYTSFGGSPLLWTGFFVAILGLLAVDLFVINRKARDIKMREALVAGIGWVSLALIFCVVVFFTLGSKPAAEFLTGYVLELSLSVDNLFVFLVLFKFFRVEKHHQHRVLFWGIIGALVLRAVFILAGTALISRWHWITYVFGMFLIITGIKLLQHKDAAPDPGKNLVLRLVYRFMPVSAAPHGGRFFLVENGKRVATTLFVCLILVEATDVVFAVDSIPAIFGVTLDTFVIYTSNVFAILGLRSLFMLLALLMVAFRFLGTGLALVLLFIGAKMLAVAADVHVPTLVSLAVVLGTLGISIVASLIWRKPPDEPPQSPSLSPPPE